MGFYRNISPHTRTWGRLTNKATGTTLQLAAGASAEVVVPKGFSDQYLVKCDGPAPAEAVSMHPAKGRPAKDTDQAAPPATAPEEE